MLLTQSQTSHLNKQVLVQLRLVATNANTRVITCVWLNQPADEME